MAIYHGKDGQIKLVTTGGTPAAPNNLKTFDIDISSENAALKYKGATTVNRIAGFKDWTITGTLSSDNANAAQNDIVEGAKIDVEVYPEAELTSGALKLTGTAIVDSIKHGSPDGDAEMTFTASAAGNLTRATVA